MIIGISAYYHDSSVALVKNNEIIDFIKEEEITRVKGDNNFPFRSLSLIIEKYKLDNSNINSIIFYEKPFRGWTYITYETFKKPIKNWKIILNQFQKFWTGSLNFRNDLSQIIKVDNDKIFYCSHHVSHTLNALMYSPNNNHCLCFVFDGVGDGETISVFIIKGNNLKRIYVEYYPKSIGLFYSTISDFLGFNINEGESKVMALASYGKPVHSEFMLENIINWHKDKIHFNSSWFDFTNNPERSFSKKFEAFFGSPPSKKVLSNINTSDFCAYANIAASAQKTLEIIICKIIKSFIDTTNLKDIVISGGAALNSKAIFEVSKIKEINSITVPQSPGDSGSSIGAAIFGQMLNNFPLPKKNLFPGKNYNSHIKSDVFKSLFKKISNKVCCISDVSNLILSGKIICIFLNGREVGPRALGSRSIICSGNNKSLIKNLNINYKNREQFRPLAPLIREEISNKYFYIPKKLKHNLYWMGTLVKAKQKAITEYPECIHIDNTSRVQIIKNKHNFLYKLLENLEKNNLNIIINTSFNIAGDPIVFDYIDCYTNMKRMNLKYLVTDKGLFERL